MSRIVQIHLELVIDLSVFVIRNLLPQREGFLDMNRLIERQYAVSARLFVQNRYCVIENESRKSLSFGGGVNYTFKTIFDELRNSPDMVKMSMGDKKEVDVFRIVGKFLPVSD